MKNVVIIGNGSYSQMMKKYVELTHFGKVHAYVADKNYIHDTILDGIEVISFDELTSKYPPSSFTLIMGIGYSQMAQIRKEKYLFCKKSGYTFENYIHPTAFISEDVILGEGNNILEGVYIQMGCQIGNANLFFIGAKIAHDSIIHDYCTISMNSMLAGHTRIHDRCFLGVGSIVKDHTTLNEAVLLGAQAYAFKDIPANKVVVPAKSAILTDKVSTDYL